MAPLALDNYKPFYFITCPLLQKSNTRPPLADSLAIQTNFLALSNISPDSRSERSLTILALSTDSERLPAVPFLTGRSFYCPRPRQNDSCHAGLQVRAVAAAVTLS
jgi:hypothetical protein